VGFEYFVEAAARRVVQTDASTALGMTGLLFSGAGDWRVASLLAMIAWRGPRCVLRGGWLDDWAEKVFTGAFLWG